jgi:hypothetical protein
MTFPQRYSVAPPRDYLTSYDAWLANLRGALPKPKPSTPGAPPSPTRYIATGRDLATYFHVDFTYQAYLNAALILGAMAAPLDSSNPYRKSRTQKNNGPTFGPIHLVDLIARVTNEAVKASWYQKWLIHRRLRPEVFGGRVHNLKIRAADYPIHPDLLERSAVLELIYRRYGTYLLPVAFPEGSPTHPSYPAAHMTIAGACVTVLKAFFDESFALPQPVAASADGATLLPYSGVPLTVGNELNKLAFNVAMARDFGGVHWRTDGVSGLLLGEAVAIGILTDQAATYAEAFKGFSLTKFDGTTITV